jgi:hypothetical protein
MYLIRSVCVVTSAGEQSERSTGSTAFQQPQQTAANLATNHVHRKRVGERVAKRVWVRAYTREGLVEGLADGVELMLCLEDFHISLFRLRPQTLLL